MSQEKKNLRQIFFRFVAKIWQIFGTKMIFFVHGRKFLWVYLWWNFVIWAYKMSYKCPSWHKWMRSDFSNGLHQYLCVNHEFYRTSSTPLFPKRILMSAKPNICIPNTSGDDLSYYNQITLFWVIIEFIQYIRTGIMSF